MSMETITVEEALMILDNPYVPVAIVDENCRYRRVNRRWQKNMKLSSEEVLGRHPEEIFEGSAFPEVIRTRKPVLLHEVVNRQYGFHSYSNYYPLFDRSGSFQGAVVLTFIRGYELALEFAKKLNQIEQKLNETTAKLNRVESSGYTIDSIIGSSQAVIEMKEAIRAAARTNSNVLIEGETGTGKELVAHAIHRLSARHAQRIVCVNCSAVPSNLLESEFFGYAPGAFTGALRNGKIGLFELASKGTLFLDEINQLPIFMQPKLLRTLQEHEVTRVGGTEVIPVSPRIIAATNAPLQTLTEKNRFRKDLYYRLNVVKIKIPPLRERKSDLYELVPHFIQRLNAQLNTNISHVEEDVIPALTAYSWPGNIRELQNVIEAAINRCLGDTLTLTHFSDFLCEMDSNNEPAQEDRTDVPGLTREAILTAIRHCGGNKARAARELGISRATLYNRLK